VALRNIGAQTADWAENTGLRIGQKTQDCVGGGGRELTEGWRKLRIEELKHVYTSVFK
jgi:hypothetical protein